MNQDFLQVVNTKLEQCESLNEDEACRLAELMIDLQIPNESIKKALLLLSEKGESVSEIMGFIKALRTRNLYINVPEETIDTCGTGGSGQTRINTSTMVAFVVAAAGVPVAKHGNKASSGRVGSFDVLEAAGINIMLKPDEAQKVFDQTGLVFLFAPLYHPALAALKEIRKELGVPTIFNILGPLLSPANVKRQVIGVSGADIAPKMIEVVKGFSSKHVLIVRGVEGLDEITVTGKSTVYELKDGEVKQYEVHPKDFGVEMVRCHFVKGGDVDYNRRIMLSVLSNKDKELRTELVLLNAAAAFVAAGRVNDLLEGYKLAKETLESGAAYKKFLQYKEVSNSFQ